MKKLIQSILQKLLGFPNYLFLFSIFKIYTLRKDRKEGDFFHFLDLIPDGGTVLDIGANIGIMTVHLSKKLPHSSVIAFEPIPENIHVLKKIIRFYNLKNVKLMECALGNYSGKVEMVMPVVSSVRMQGLSHVVHDTIIEFNEGKKYQASMRTLDEIPELKSAKLTAVKLDVENFEFFVLEGGKQLIAKNKPIIYTELWENENRQKCFDFLTSHGYKIEVREKNMLVAFDKGKHKTQNFFFIP